MKYRLIVLCLALVAGCSALSKYRVASPKLAAGVETIEFPGTQEESPSPVSDLPPDEFESIDKLTPGDFIAIQVYNHPNLSLDVRIPLKGEVSYPVIGKVQLADRTIEEVETDVRSRLEEKLLNSAQVTVLVKSYRKRSAYVVGNVKKPGSYEIFFGRPLTLLQVISMAGGFTQGADRDNILLMRENGGSGKKRVAYRVAYSEIVKNSSLSKDVKLKDGDVLVVRQRDKVYVLGKVKKPGGFTAPSDKKMTLTMVISLAGGPGPSAAWSKTTIIRAMPDGTARIFRINVGAIIDGSLRDLTVLPGDIVFVPESLF